MEQTKESTTPTQNPTDDETTQVKNPEAVLAKNRALLDNLAKTKARLNELEEYKQTQEMAVEERKGNYEGVISQLKEKVRTLEADNKTIESRYANTFLNEAIKNTAMAKGIKGTHLDAFMRLVDPQAKNVVEFERTADSIRVNETDVNNLVDDHLKRYSDVFKRTVKVADGNPTPRMDNSSRPAFDLSKASAAETLAYLKANKDKLD